jgi:hypothetical protein
MIYGQEPIKIKYRMVGELTISDMPAPVTSGPIGGGGRVTWNPARHSQDVGLTPKTNRAKKLIPGKLKTWNEVKQFTRKEGNFITGRDTTRIYHSTIDKCLTVHDKDIYLFGSEVWLTVKYNYDESSPGARKIYKVYTKEVYTTVGKKTVYTGFDCYDEWLEWIGEKPEPLTDMEDLFEL